MLEQLVSKKTLRLVKFMGFNCTQRIICAFKENGIEYENAQRGISQGLLQKWLREKHGIHIDIKYDTLNVFTCILKRKFVHNLLPNSNVFKTYEDALEYGLQESLKLIKD